MAEEVRKTAVMEVKGETSDGQRAAKRLRREVENIGKGAQRAQRETSISLDKMTAGLLKFQLGVTTATQALGSFKRFLDFSQEIGEIRQLDRITDDALVNGIQVAVGGTIDKLSIMREVAKANTGEFKLLEDEMKDVFVAADVLSNRGFGPATEIARQMFEAIRKGETEELKKFGLSLETTGSRVDKVKSVLQALHGVAENAEPIDRQKLAADQLKTTFEDLSVVMADELGPGLEGVAQGLMEVVKALGFLQRELSSGVFDLLEIVAGPANAGADGAATSRAVAHARARGASAREVDAIRRQEAREAAAAERFGADVGSGSRLLDTSGSPLLTGDEQIRIHRENAFRDKKPAVKKRTTKIEVVEEAAPGSFFPGGGGLAAGMAGRQQLANLDALGGPGGSLGGLGGLGGRGSLGSTLGGPNRGDLNSLLQQEVQEMSRLQNDVTDLATSATAAAIDAAISGQKSIVDATRDAIAETLRMKAIEYGVLAIGSAASAAFGVGPGLQAAGQYAAAAAAAGAGAALLGKSAPPAPSLPPGGGFAAGASRSSRGAGQTFIFQSSGGSERDLAFQFATMQREAERRGLLNTRTVRRS